MSRPEAGRRTGQAQHWRYLDLQMLKAYHPTASERCCSFKVADKRAERLWVLGLRENFGYLIIVWLIGNEPESGDRRL